MKFAMLFVFIFSSQAFSSELSQEVKQAFEQDQNSSCTVKQLPSFTSDPVFSVSCENYKIASSFTIVIQDNSISGSGETWLKKTANEGVCEVSGKIENQNITALDIYCLSK